MDSKYSGNEHSIRMFNIISTAIDKMHASDFPEPRAAQVDPGHVKSVRDRFESSEPKDVVMTGTEEHARLTAKRIPIDVANPRSIKKAVDAIEGGSAEPQTHQSQNIAAEQAQPTGIKPGTVAKAVRNIENGKAAEGRAQLDERNDHTRSGRG